MANNYSQFSEAIVIPEEKRQAIIEFLEEWEGRMEDPQYDCMGGISYEFPSTDDLGTLALWFYSEEAYMDEELSAFVHGVLDVLKSKEPVLVNVAYWCSKPRIGEFSGGCYVFYPDPEKDYYEDPFTAATDYIKFHSDEA